MSDDATRAITELAAVQHRVLTRQQAAALHFDYRRVATAKRAGWLAEVLPGILVMTGSAPTWYQRLMVLVLAGGGQTACHIAPQGGCTGSTALITPAWQSSRPA